MSAIVRDASCSRVLMRGGSVLTRLIDLVAEDNAIEDTIYHLARALDTERIDLDRFLKVRCAYRPCSFPLVFGRILTQRLWRRKRTANPHPGQRAVSETSDDPRIQTMMAGNA